MSRLAVKQYVADQCATTAIPSGVTLFTSIQSYRQRPKEQKLGTTFAISVGEARRRETRMAGGRPTGRKWAHYELDVLFFATATDDQAGGDQFDVMIETIANTFRTVSLSGGIAITDPITAAATTIFLIGEEIDDHVYEPYLTSPEGKGVGRVAFSGLMTLFITEILADA